MEHEYSCGAVVYTRVGKKALYLIVTEKSGQRGFPKGHMEPGETERETALREIKEETGIDAKLMGNVYYRMEYLKSDNVMKHVAYFIAEYSGQLISPEQEMGGAQLMTMENALKALSYDSCKKMLIQVAALVEKRK